MVRSDVCVGCTADGAGGRVEARVVNGRMTVREEEERGGGEEKRQRVPEVAPAVGRPRRCLRRWRRQRRRSPRGRRRQSRWQTG